MDNLIQNTWSAGKVLVKGVIIAVLVLLLQIPAYFIRNLVEEREETRRRAIQEVSSRWAGEQNIAGPILLLPYREAVTDQLNNRVYVRKYAYFLPDQLNISGKVTPQAKYRGIHKVMLYNAELDIQGSFGGIEPEKLNLDSSAILWNEAYIRLDISDRRGLNEELVIKWKGSDLVLSPNAPGISGGQGSMYAKLPFSGREELEQSSFSAKLLLKGSQELFFTPVGKSTNVELISSWKHPSFTGAILPHPQQTSDSGFHAIWKSMSHNRNFPQQWRDGDLVTPFNDRVTDHYDRVSRQSSAFGVLLYLPVSDYQKVMRSVKYATLCILLTFAAFFLIDANNRKAVHPFQYGLIGLALVLFYTLLLSFSEYLGFNISYGLSSVLIIGLVSWFARSVLDSSRLSMVLTMILLLMYLYLFIILQLQDYALLFGSLGLFITLGVIMYFSRRFRW